MKIFYIFYVKNLFLDDYYIFHVTIEKKYSLNSYYSRVLQMAIFFYASHCSSHLHPDQ